MAWSWQNSISRRNSLVRCLALKLKAMIYLYVFDNKAKYMKIKKIVRRLKK